MKNIISLAIVFFATAFADQVYQPDAHLVAEAEAKQAMVERLQSANITVTDNQKQYDVNFYSLDLFPDVESRILYGDVEMRATVVQSGFDSVELDFLDNMVVESVFVNDQPAVYKHENDILSIQLGASLEKNESFTTRVIYHGTPVRSGFGSFVFDSHAGKPMVWSLSEPYGARNWWPCKDAPIDKADSVDIKVKVRSDLIVASNGTLKSVTEQGDFVTYYWQERYPIVTYLVS